MSKPIHTGTNQLGTLSISPDLPICTACGTQYATAQTACKICDDPRQYVPPSGQAFTTLSKASATHSLEFEPESDTITSIRITPNLGIGQRALLIKTPHGNILWDLVCYLDQAAVDAINAHGGISAIVISHPHFWTSWRDWSETFRCPVYLAAADKAWLSREANEHLVLLERSSTIVEGVEAIICGGHFDGSMALYYANERALFHADTIYTVPNGRSPDIGTKMDELEGHNAYSFMWSIPNMIPLSPRQILGIWRALKGREIDATYGFVTVRYAGGMRIERRILESMKRFVRACGYREGMDVEGLEILGESVD